VVAEEVVPHSVHPSQSTPAVCAVVNQQNQYQQEISTEGPLA